ncbi:MULTISPECIES: hypothetical protein [Streptomyces violaceusniger group]|uniref:Uncharacterized protein n=3 Tax=Streptomyces violaceusniger group TaxID=2839105 RepID=A0ABN1QJQ2_9ACTN|nr:MULTISPECIES: hypothetical protein [Streptomyces violaceusniger group]
MSTQQRTAQDTFPAALTPADLVTESLNGRKAQTTGIGAVLLCVVGGGEAMINATTHLVIVLIVLVLTGTAGGSFSRQGSKAAR